MREGVGFSSWQEPAARTFQAEGGIGPEIPRHRKEVFWSMVSSALWSFQAPWGQREASILLPLRQPEELSHSSAGVVECAVISGSLVPDCDGGGPTNWEGGETSIFLENLTVLVHLLLLMTQYHSLGKF